MFLYQIKKIANNLPSYNCRNIELWKTLAPGNPLNKALSNPPHNDQEQKRVEFQQSSSLQSYNFQARLKIQKSKITQGHREESLKH